MLYYLLYFIFVGVIPFCGLLYLSTRDSVSSKTSRPCQYRTGVRVEDLEKISRECRGKSPAERRRIINSYCR